MRHRVGLEAQRSLAVERHDVVPAEHRRLAAVPRERVPPAGDAGRDEHRGAEAVRLEHGQRVVAHVGEAVVERQPDGPRRQLLRVEQRQRLEQVDHAIAPAARKSICSRKRAGGTASGSPSSATRW